MTSRVSMRLSALMMPRKSERLLKDSRTPPWRSERPSMLKLSKTRVLNSNSKRVSNNSRSLRKEKEKRNSDDVVLVVVELTNTS